MSRDDETPVERPRRSSSTSLSLWGNIDAWVSLREGRYIIQTAGMKFRVVDENIGEVIVTVKLDEEDVSAALYRRGVQVLIARGNAPPSP